VTTAIVLDAFRVRERYRLGFFDSQIVAAAIAARASVLYSEDLHHGLLVDGSLRLADPFRGGIEQRLGPYRVRRHRRTLQKGGI
jgi:predicted nucleic acid-binding protein